MQHHRRSVFLRTLAGASAALSAAGPARALAQGAVPLSVAYAGSMGSLMEGPVKAAAEQRLGISFQGQGEGSDGLANLIVAGSIRPDVFLPVTPGPMETVLRGAKAREGVPVARTSMVIAYSPRSRFAEQFAAAAAGRPGAMPWWQILAQPGIRFGRTDPLADPQGRNIIFVMQLAAKLYKQPDLVHRIIGDDLSPQQTFGEPSVMARLQSGELDAASAYKIQPGPFNLPYVTLPAEIDLSDDRLRAQYATATLTLNGKTYHPETLAYYAAVLDAAPHPQQARAFVDWLRGEEAQAIFRRAGYEAPGTTSTLRAS
ncbi:MAG TPA: extracellular solute-binding protein [Candidatus Limnocylindria bacterium]|jgi:molybdate/tungstate transport system substrate-binding protein|nr:extracellular solute-binding protein [Candidatus Limnocylindria bacterium]